jgi:hypothetical protein
MGAVPVILLVDRPHEVGGCRVHRDGDLATASGHVVMLNWDATRYERRRGKVAGLHESKSH